MKNLLLLHGALGCETQFKPLIPFLKDDFQVTSLSFSSHGENSVSDAKFSIELFAKDVIEYARLNNMSKLNIFGYSMGGYVGLYLARFFPELIDGVFTLATKFDWTKETALKEASMLDPEFMELKIPAFVEILKDRHGAKWKEVVVKTAEMMLEMGNKNPLDKVDFLLINCKVLIGLGDLDKMVNTSETMKIIDLIPHSRFVSLKDTPHAFEKVNCEELSEKIKYFFDEAHTC